MTTLRRKLARLMSRGYQVILNTIPNPPAKDNESLVRAIGERGIPASLNFSFPTFRSQVLDYIESMRTTNGYRYSASCSLPCIYANAYALLSRIMLDGALSISGEERLRWIHYLTQLQDPIDGLFRDPVIACNEFSSEADWWGARHLLLHLMPIFVALGTTPRHRLKFLEQYKDSNHLNQWLDSYDLKGKISYLDDFDNRVMNIAAALQFERDFLGDQMAGAAVERIKMRLLDSIDSHTGLWGDVDAGDARDLSRAVQFAYHLYPMFFYDDDNIVHANRLIDLVLDTQNVCGGYGVQLNSSACEDIDSIDLLCRLSKLTDWRRDDINLSLMRAKVWVLANQNTDGGFVFRRNEALTYGHAQMSSARNESAMFPTWFRTLSLVYIERHFGRLGNELKRCPGLQF